jgi:histidinol dehydrogenase
MFRIISSTDERAVSALLDRRPARDRRLESRVARIVARVRRDGNPALLAFARRFDKLALPLEVSASRHRPTCGMPFGWRLDTSVAWRDDRFRAPGR